MEPTVSIIVPVYNAEKYMKRCIDSILGQEYADFELLLVDDGSRDSSGTICDEYAEKDLRVRTIHKANSGVSASRNLAISQAKGIYLQFVDSDDWLTPDATRLLVRAAKDHDCDLVIADFYRVIGERVSHKGDIEEDGVLTREEFAACMMESPADFYYGVLWNKLYRREIVERYHLRMDADISWCEDFMFNLEYIRHAEIFYALRTPIYYYVRTKGSLSSQGMNISKTIKMKLMVFEYYDNFYKNVLDEEDYERNRLQVYRFLVESAKDGVVLPAILSGTKKLGDERSSVCAELLREDGIMTDAYRDRKLLERYLEPAALKNELSLKEIFILLYLKQSPLNGSRREIADFLNVSRSSLSLALQKLAARGLIRMEESRGTKEKNADRHIKVSFFPAADSLLADLTVAENDYHQTRFAGFSEAEMAQYLKLEEKIKKNIQKVLQ